MKTAEEWWEQLRQGTTQVAVATIPDIRMIQADAMRECSRIIYNRSGDMMAAMLSPNCATIAHDLELEARRLIDKTLG